jgi:hypothetical protein
MMKFRREDCKTRLIEDAAAQAGICDAGGVFFIC